MGYQRTTMDEWNIQQWTKWEGWETVTRDLSAHAAFITRNEYRDNQPDYPVRIKKSRFKRADFTASALRGFEREAREGRERGYEYRRLRRNMNRAKTAAFHHADQRMAQPNFIGPMYIGR